MIPRPLAMFLLARLLAPWVLAGAASAEPQGSYDLVDLRRLAGVAGPPMGGEVPFPERLHFGPGAADCRTDGPPAAPPLDLGDPMLSDLAWMLPDGQARGWRVACADGAPFSLAEADGRVLVAVSADGGTAGLFERPLDARAIAALQASLRDRKFLSAAPNGELDDTTLAGLGFYLDYLGLPYRFRRPALSEALLRELGVVPD